MSEEQLRAAALEYHEFPRPGKVSITPTKALANQRDLFSTDVLSTFRKRSETI